MKVKQQFLLASAKCSNAVARSSNSSDRKTKMMNDSITFNPVIDRACDGATLFVDIVRF